MYSFYIHFNLFVHCAQPPKSPSNFTICLCHKVEI